MSDRAAHDQLLALDAQLRSAIKRGGPSWIIAELHRCMTDIEHATMYQASEIELTRVRMLAESLLDLHAKLTCVA